MRHILLSAAVGVLSLFLINPVSAGHPGGGGGGGGGGHPGGGGVHPGGGGGVYHGGGGYYHNGGYPHYGYGYPGIGIGIGLGYGLGYGAAYPYYDSTPIYVPPVGPTVGPSSAYSYYPPDAPVLGSAIAPPAVAPPPEAAPAAVNVPADEAYVRVLVPDANAEVLLEGKATDVLGRDRLFSSPKLDPGSKYTYTVTASWLDQGHLVRQTREVALTAGHVSVVDFRRVR